MSQTIDVNGQSINYPETGDTNWGDEATDFAVQTSAAFGKLGLASGISVDIAQTLDVTGNTTLDANLSVAGTTSLTGNVTLTNNLTVNGNTTLGNASGDTITVTGIVNIDSGVLYVDPVNNRVGINDTTPSEALDINGNAAITGNETVGGTLTVTGDVAINTNKFNVTASSGNTTIAGTLGVTGNTTLTGQALVSDGTASLPGIAFSSDTNSGFYRISSDKIGIATNGSRIGEIGTNYGGFTGNVIQMVDASNNYNHTIINSADWGSNLLSGVGTPWEISITPRYANSKILLLGFINISLPAASPGNYVGFSLWRKIGSGSYTQIYTPMSYENGQGVNAEQYRNTSRIYVDLPGSTSTISYKFTVRTLYGSFIHSVSDGTNRASSFVILQEIQQ